jgi:hypothetical protein
MGTGGNQSHGTATIIATSSTALPTRLPPVPRHCPQQLGGQIMDNARDRRRTLASRDNRKMPIKRLLSFLKTSQSMWRLLNELTEGLIPGKKKNAVTTSPSAMRTPDIGKGQRMKGTTKQETSKFKSKGTEAMKARKQEAIDMHSYNRCLRR